MKRFDEIVSAFVRHLLSKIPCQNLFESNARVDYLKIESPAFYIFVFTKVL